MKFNRSLLLIMMTLFIIIAQTGIVYSIHHCTEIQEIECCCEEQSSCSTDTDEACCHSDDIVSNESHSWNPFQVKCIEAIATHVSTFFDNGYLTYGFKHKEYSLTEIKEGNYFAPPDLSVLQCFRI